ncbi:MAG: hypothetical protein H2058_09140 [Muricauda sp.]|nr:7TM diverse intracellular signaling domain-containing protein [Allomuricauda sp.]MBA4745412.1 hypothetical protein [Allomuricauda sp.]
MLRLARNLSILLVCWLWHPCFAQEATFEKEVSFKIIKATDTSLSIKDILNQTEEFKLPRQFEQKTDPKDIYWIRLDFEDNIASKESDATFYLKHNTFDHGAIYHKNKSGIVKKNIGQFDKDPIAKRIRGSNYYSYLEFNIQDLINDRYLILKVQRITFKEDISNWHFNYSTLSPDKYGTPDDFYQQIFYGVFAGICLIIWFSTTSMYLLQQKREFLYYSTYLLLLFIYLTGRYFGFFQFVLNDSPLQHWASQGFIFSSNIAYGYFLIAYLNTKKDYPIIHYACLAAIVGNIAIIILMGVFYSLNYIDGLTFLVGHSQKTLNLYGLLARSCF